LTKEQEAHEAIMDFIRRTQIEEARQDLQRWIDRYEYDTEHLMQKRIDALKQKRLENSERYSEVSAQVEVMTKEVEEFRAAREKERATMELLQKQVIAAMRIQRWWRKKLAERKAKSKKKGGKKKK
jgi:hypothetical protein